MCEVLGPVAVGEAEGEEVSLTTQQKDEILRLRGTGATLKYISSQVGCSIEGARQVCRRIKQKRELESNTQRLIKTGVPPSRIRIDQIAMSARAFRALNTLGVIYLSEVSQFTEREFLTLQGISGKTLWEIYERVLEPFGLKLESNGKALNSSTQ